jgi:polar amino acid transport system substrate-binding protein
MSRTHLSRRSTLTLSAAAALVSARSHPAAATTTLDGLHKAGVLRIGCEAAYVPFTYRDDHGAIIGYDVDLLARFVKPLGIKAEFIDTQWSGVIPALYAGRFEMIPGVSYTKERLQNVLFSIPYADASQALLVRAKDKAPIKTVDDMSGRVLGIKLGSPGETLKDKLDAQIKAARGAGFAAVKTYDDHPSAYLALAQGSVDGVLNTVPTLSVVLRDKPGLFDVVYHVGSDNWHGFAFRKEDTELKTFIDGQIESMKANGELAALQQKWFGFTMKLSDTIPVLS